MSADDDASEEATSGEPSTGDDAAPSASDGADPYTLQSTGGEAAEDEESAADRHHAFWADEIADRIEARNPEEPIVIKGGISPSGIPHLGNANEIVLPYFVAAVLRERGHEVRQVFTTDDRDPLRGLPRKLADLDGDIVGLGDVDAAALGQNLGKPYTDIPDPFGCCASYGAHFSTLIEGIAEQLAVPVDVVSNTELYESGDFDDQVRLVMEREDLARDTLAEYQDKVDADYVPFNPICEDCGKITETVTAVHLADEAATAQSGEPAGDGDDTIGTVEYRCTDLDAGDDTIEGCGHDGTATLREGKLPWRFEWVAQWDHLGVDFEPFGKDHAEGSWPSGVDIAETVFEIAPPLPMVYEWFTLDGEPFSSSAGHVIMVSEVLELIEPEVLRYFFAKDPSRARDFSIERLDQLVGEFDRVERLYFAAQDGATIEDPDATVELAGEEGVTQSELAFAERVYPFLVEEVQPERVRIPYSFAAVLGMTDDPELREEIARREGHIPDDAPEWAIEAALDRVERARRWARHTDNEYNYELKREAMPDVELDAATEAALDDLADFIEAHDDPDEIQGEVYEAAKRHDVDVGDFFATGYRLFFDQEEGPKLGQFLAKLDEAFVLRRLRREG